MLTSLFAGTSVGYRVLENHFVVLSSVEMLQKNTVSGIVTVAGRECHGEGYDDRGGEIYHHLNEKGGQQMFDRTLIDLPEIYE